MSSKTPETVVEGEGERELTLGLVSRHRLGRARRLLEERKMSGEGAVSSLGPRGLRRERSRVESRTDSNPFSSFQSHSCSLSRLTVDLWINFLFA